MKRTELTGKRVGKLVVLGLAENHKPGRLYWKCVCDCGREHTVVAQTLIEGKVRSCGCLGLAKDLAGRQFGCWVVLERVLNSKGRGTKNYICRCECGTVKTVGRRELLKGFSRSCGCRLFLKDGLAAMRGVMGTYKKSAETRNFVWELSEDLFHDITSRNCHYCGIEPAQIRKTGTKSRYTYNGIDRVDSLRGYTPDNVVACCKTCNFAKHTLPKQDFMNWVNRIYKNLLKSSVLLEMWTECKKLLTDPLEIQDWQTRIDEVLK